MSTPSTKGYPHRFSPWILGLLVLAAVLVVILRLGEMREFANLVRRARPQWLLLGLLLQAGTYVCAGGVWYLVLNRAGAYRRLIDVVPLGLAKLFADQAIPAGGIGGTLLVIRGMSRRGISPALTMAALLVGLQSFYGAYLLMVIASLVILAALHAIGPATVGAVAIFSLVAIGIPTAVLLFRTRLRKSSSGFLWRIPGLASLRDAIVDAPSSLVRDPVLIGETLLLQLSVFLLDAATLYVMLFAIDTTAAPASVFASFIMASVAATIGPVPLGLGTFEAVSVAMLKLNGVPLEAALTGTLLLRGLTFWLPMLPGLWIARRELGPDLGGGEPDDHGTTAAPCDHSSS